MKAATFALATVLSLATVAAGVMAFGFAYWAIFTPGRNEDLTAASFVTIVLTVVLGGLSVGAWTAWDVVRTR